MNEIKVTNTLDPRLDVYGRLNETQLRHYYEPNGGLFIAESPKVTERAMNAGHEPVSVLMDEKDNTEECQRVLARMGDVPIYVCTLGMLREVSGIPMNRGMLCCLKRNPLPTVESLLQNARRVAVLENVTNPTNVGAIFRSAAALGIDAVLLNDACADPYYRRASRVSMGCVFQVPWTYLYIREETMGAGQGKATLSGGTTTGQEKTAQATEAGEYASGLLKNASLKLDSYVPFLKRLGFKTAAMALRDDTVRIDDPTLMAEEKLAIFLGAEGDGLLPETIASCDYTVKIPMTEGVDSLNVAAASAVAFWQLAGRGK